MFIDFGVFYPLYRAKVIFMDEYYGSKINGSLTIDAGGKKNFVDVSTKFTQNKDSGLYFMATGGVKDEGEFFGNFTINEQHHHMHFDINITRPQLEIVVDSDFNDDGNEIKKTTQTTVNDKRRKDVFKSDSFVIINRQKRTFDYL